MDLKRLKWFFLIVLALIWGSSFILMKKGLVGLNPFQMGSMRIIFTAIFLLIFGFSSLKEISRKQWKIIVITSFFGTFAPVYLFALAETELSSSICSILNSLTPLFTLMLGSLIFGIFYKKTQFIGVILGFLGSALLVFFDANSGSNSNVKYAFLVVLASIGYGINVNLIKKKLSNLNPVSITTGNFVILLVPALIILGFTNFFEIIHTNKTQHSVVFILILGVLGTGVANIIFFRLIQISTPVFASSVTYLIPIIACCWGILDHEFLTPIQIVGAVVILIGVYLSSKIK